MEKGFSTAIGRHAARVLRGTGVQLSFRTKTVRGERHPANPRRVQGTFSRRISPRLPGLGPQPGHRPQSVADARTDTRLPATPHSAPRAPPRLVVRQPLVSLARISPLRLPLLARRGPRHLPAGL